MNAWDRADAARYEAWFTSPLGAFVDALEGRALLRAVADLTPGSRLVDIGAGIGHFTRTSAGRHRVVAVEPSRAMLEEGRGRSVGLPVHWCVAVGERLALGQRSVDAAGRRAGNRPAMEALRWNLTG